MAVFYFVDKKCICLSYFDFICCTKQTKPNF